MSRMVLFECRDCKERFPAFHPAYEPPPEIAEKMEVLRAGKNGVATCCMAVASWAEFPPSPESMAGGEAWKEDDCDFAGRFSGTCV
eukprot:1307292-Pyramimonas_sp.AAC.1